MQTSWESLCFEAMPLMLLIALIELTIDGQQAHQEKMKFRMSDDPS
jgi:hypothetical protein